MDKGPRFLLCENLQTTPEDFYVLHNRKPFVVIRFNPNLEIVGIKLISNSVDEKSVSKVKIQAEQWIRQYIKDKKLQQ